MLKIVASIATILNCGNNRGSTLKYCAIRAVKIHSGEMNAVNIQRGRPISSASSAIIDKSSDELRTRTLLFSLCSAENKQYMIKFLKVAIINEAFIKSLK